MSDRWAILDLPYLDPVFVDLDIPIERQLPAGPVLEAAKKMLAEAKEPHEFKPSRTG